MNDMLMMLCLMRMLMHVVIGLNACLTPRVLHVQALYRRGIRSALSVEMIWTVRLRIY